MRNLVATILALALLVSGLLTPRLEAACATGPDASAPTCGSARPASGHDCCCDHPPSEPCPCEVAPTPPAPQPLESVGSTAERPLVPALALDDFAVAAPARSSALRPVDRPECPSLFFGLRLHRLFGVFRE